MKHLLCTQLYLPIAYCYIVMSNICIVGSSTPISQADLDKQLRTACAEVNNNAIESLLQQGACPLATDELGNNCFHTLVVAAGVPERENPDRYVPLIKLLLYHITQTVLKSVDNSSRPHVISTLIIEFAGNPASIQSNKTGKNPLHLILESQSPNLEIATLFIQGDPTCIEAQDKQGRLPEKCSYTIVYSDILKQHYEKTKTEILALIKKYR